MYCSMAGCERFHRSSVLASFQNAASNREKSRRGMASGGISTSRMANSKPGGPVQERAKEMYWLSSSPSFFLRWLSKNSFSGPREGMSRLASSVCTAKRIGELFGDDQSALYPAALIAA